MNCLLTVLSKAKLPCTVNVGYTVNRRDKGEEMYRSTHIAGVHADHTVTAPGTVHTAQRIQGNAAWPRAALWHCTRKRLRDRTWASPGSSTDRVNITKNRSEEESDGRRRKPESDVMHRRLLQNSSSNTKETTTTARRETAPRRRLKIVYKTAVLKTSEQQRLMSALSIRVTNERHESEPMAK